MIPHYQSYESSACSCKVFNTPGQTVNIVKQKCYMCRRQRLSNLYQGTETEGLQGLKVYKSVIFPEWNDCPTNIFNDSKNQKIWVHTFEFILDGHTGSNSSAEDSIMLFNFTRPRPINLSVITIE